MAGKVQYLLNRDGRFFARLIIPKELRPFMNGRTELRTALGPDYRTAVKRLSGAVALLQHEIALAERRAVGAGERKVTVGRYSLAVGELAELVGERIERYRRLGNTTSILGTDEWRTLARGICVSEYEALARAAERDEGDFTGKPAHPLIAQATPEPDQMSAVSALETVQGFSGREDFWIIAAILERR